jgi:hypothetical protein
MSHPPSAFQTSISSGPTTRVGQQRRARVPPKFNLMVSSDSRAKIVHTNGGGPGCRCSRYRQDIPFAPSAGYCGHLFCRYRRTTHLI